MLALSTLAPSPSTSCISRRHRELPLRVGEVTHPPLLQAIPPAPFFLSRLGPTPRDADHLSVHSLDNRNFQRFPKHGWIGEHGFGHCLLESWGSSGDAGSRKLYLGTLIPRPSPGAFLPLDRELWPTRPLFTWNLCRDLREGSP